MAEFIGALLLFIMICLAASWYASSGQRRRRDEKRRQQGEARERPPPLLGPAADGIERDLGRSLPVVREREQEADHAAMSADALFIRQIGRCQSSFSEAYQLWLSSLREDTRSALVRADANGKELFEIFLEVLAKSDPSAYE
jgi:hypothetical protein